MGMTATTAPQTFLSLSLSSEPDFSECSSCFSACSSATKNSVKATHLAVNNEKHTSFLLIDISLALLRRDRAKYNIHLFQTPPLGLWNESIMGTNERAQESCLKSEKKPTTKRGP
jgi:hypothetical protein